jgi:hypothetical protein
MLYQITSGYYCAGFIIKNGKVINAAPIIRWMMGRHIDYVTQYCTYKKFKLEKI